MRKLFFIFLLFFSAILAGGIFWAVYQYTSWRPILVKEAVEKMDESKKKVDLFQSLYSQPLTLLVLFLNNTELRPAGGFIGSYAVVKMENGRTELLQVQGTEILDNMAPSFVSAPPDALRTYLGIDKWSFRDSNWSPDFAISAQKALELYKKEKGLSAEEIDAVIGFTPTVVENLLRLTGPISANGEEFNADNFTEKLEYEVEYGFADRGISFSDRKKMLADLAGALLARLKDEAWKQGTAYWQLGNRMLAEKQIVAYALNPEWQQMFSDEEWSGEMRKTTGDYWQWVDANLGALKTDAVMERNLDFAIKPIEGGYAARVTMRYTHGGKLDWRTSRYRTYARLYTPSGSKLIKAEGQFKNALGVEGAYDQGEENGRQWFGAFTVVEPGKSGALTFEYELAPKVIEQVVLGSYNLLVQKQIGTLAPKLTLGLDFGKKLLSGNDRYEAILDLNEDREIKLKF